MDTVLKVEIQRDQLETVKRLLKDHVSVLKILQADDPYADFDDSVRLVRETLRELETL